MCTWTPCEDTAAIQHTDYFRVTSPVQTWTVVSVSPRLKIGKVDLLVDPTLIVIIIV